MPWAFIQPMRRLTSAMTSGPIPSPASRRRLWVGMERSLVDRPARIAIGQCWVSQAACLGGDNGYRSGGRRLSLDLVLRLILWLCRRGRWGRYRWNGRIACGVSALDLLGE